MQRERDPKFVFDNINGKIFTVPRDGSYYQAVVHPIIVGILEKSPYKFQFKTVIRVGVVRKVLLMEFDCIEINLDEVQDQNPQITDVTSVTNLATDVSNIHTKLQDIIKSLDNIKTINIAMNESLQELKQQASKSIPLSAALSSDDGRGPRGGNLLGDAKRDVNNLVFGGPVVFNRIKLWRRHEISFINDRPFEAKPYMVSYESDETSPCVLKYDQPIVAHTIVDKCGRVVDIYMEY